MSRIYLDWAATAVPEMVLPAAPFGNPSSAHAEGREAREALESARSRCAAVLGVKSENLYFTSGGTESNTLVLHSFLLHALSLGSSRARLLCSAVEHPSVMENCLLLEKLKVPVGYITVEKDGRVSEGTFAGALKKYPDARFAAVMGVNNETGSMMEMGKLVSLARQNGEKTGLPVHIHADLVQALGKVPVDITGWDLDSASFSSHKLGGPRGIGLLYMKKPMPSLYRGGEQEGGFRPGTENTQGALALADVLERRACAETVRAESEKARERFRYLIGNLKELKQSSGKPICTLLPDDRGEDDPRFSPWILQARFAGIPGAVMVRALDEAGVAVSTGSACSSSSPDRPILSAMGLDKSAQLEGIRISQGWTTEKADLDALLSGIEKVLSCLK